MRSARCRSSTLLLAALLAVLGLLPACSPQESPPAPRPGLRPGEAGGGKGTYADGAVLQARSLRVQDGDSFVARLADGRRITIRLSGIDAPERSQPFSAAARRSLLRLLDEHPLQVHVAKYDQYGRAVAQVFVAGDAGLVDAGLVQLQAGMAWFYRRYRNDLPATWREPYAAAEEAARRAGSGLWQEGKPQPPWEYRLHQRNLRRNHDRSDRHDRHDPLELRWSRDHRDSGQVAAGLAGVSCASEAAGTAVRWRTVS